MRKLLIAFIFCCPTVLFAQLGYAPPAILLTDATGNFFPSGSGTALPYAPPAYACYTNVSGSYVPCTFSGGGGSGTVNSGTQFHLAYYATSTTAVSSAPDIQDNGSGTVTLPSEINTATVDTLANATTTGAYTVNIGTTATGASANLALNIGSSTAVAAGATTSVQIYCNASQNNCFNIGTNFSNTAQLNVNFNNVGIAVPLILGGNTQPAGENAITACTGTIALLPGNAINTCVLTGNTTFTLAAPNGAGQEIAVAIQQTASNTFTASFPTGTLATTTASPITVTAGKISLYTLRYSTQAARWLVASSVLNQ